MADWIEHAESCLVAVEPNTDLANKVSREFMPRDDYPLIGTLASDAIALGNVNAAIRLVEALFPGWGYQVGRPLTVRSPCGWYASVFRERREHEPMHPFPGSFTQCSGDDTPWRYAADPALAIMAALCRALAANEPGTSALAA
jgi:hypothetical protein